MKTFKWLPFWGDGESWILWQTNHRKGYPHYCGRVFKNKFEGCYQCEAGQYPTMAQAAKALLANETES